MYWSHFVELSLHMHALWSLDSDPLGNHILVLYFYFELVSLPLEDHSKIGLDGIDLCY